MDFSQRDRELIDHYTLFQGKHTELFIFRDLPDIAPKPIIVLEFAPHSEEYDWMYITVGASRKAMPGAKSKHRIELLMYSKKREMKLASVLAKLSIYPFVNKTWFDVGHTIAGSQNDGVIDNSPLTDFLLTYPYPEADEFGVISHTDGTHTQILWANPIYRSERLYAIQYGWKMLIEKFLEKEVEPADLWRQSVINNERDS
jgi:hypothetical protein